MKLVTVFVAALMMGCSGHFSAQQLAGRYALLLNGGTDTVELNSDGTYKHSYRTPHGLVDDPVESWSVEDSAAGRTVVLKNFRSLREENTQGRGPYLLLVKRSYGHFHLISNRDLGTGYEKLS